MCYSVPLIAKGQVKGVLELYHRSSLNPDDEWQSFLDAMAVQAAIAIDHAELVDRLRRLNIELMLAYDTTLEGWARALELMCGMRCALIGPIIRRGRPRP